MLRTSILLLFFSITFSISAQTRAERLLEAYQELAQGQMEESLASFQTLAEEDEDDPEAWIGLGTVYYEMRRPNSSLDAMAFARDLNEDDPRPSMYIGLVHFDHKNFRPALEAFQKTYKLDSLYTQVNYHLGACLVELGDTTDAGLFLEAQETLEGPHAYCNYYLGKWLINRSEHDSALYHMERATEIDERIPRFWLGLGDAHYANFDLDEAVLAYGSALSRNPEYAEARFRRGLCFLMTEKYDLAIIDLEKSNEAMPEDMGNLVALSEAYVGAGRHKEAANTYEKLMGMNPGEMEYLYKRGLSLLGAKMYKEALDDFSILADSFPNDASTAFHLANCYEGLEDLPNALIHYDQCLVLDPAHSRAAFNKGSVLFGMDRRSEACDIWMSVEEDEIVGDAAKRALKDYCQ